MSIVREIDERAAQELEVIAAADLLEREIGAGIAGPGRSKKTGDDGTRLSRGSNASSYLAARLKRDRPDLAAEVEGGRMTIRAAARQAKILKPPQPLRELKRWWGRATDMNRAQFEDWIDAWLRDRNDPV
jgi:hypothetical protein